MVCCENHHASTLKYHHQYLTVPSKDYYHSNFPIKYQDHPSFSQSFSPNQHSLSSTNSITAHVFFFINFFIYVLIFVSNLLFEAFQLISDF